MSDNKRENMFAKLAAQAAGSAQEEPVAVEPQAPEAPPSPAPPPAAKAKPPAGRKKAERVGGKRDNPNYCQANCYIPKTVRRSVERALLDMEGMDYSTLVEELLVKWLKTRRVAE